MPFSTIPGICTEKQWTSIFENLIRPFVESTGLGYSCRRSNPTRGNIIKDIVNELSDSDAVIADLTGQNANVFYELGVRHALRGRSILIAQDKKYIPSDLSNYAYHIYDWRSSRAKREFEERLHLLLHNLTTSIARSDNPVEDFLHRTAETEVLWLLTQADSEIQRVAMKEEIEKCVRTLHQIRAGQIPIEGGDTGYFDHYLRLIEANKTTEHVKVFVKATGLELGQSSGLKSFERFGLQELYGRLAKAVKQKKITTEYTFLLLSKTSLDNPDVVGFLKRYKAFSQEIRLVFEDATTLEPQDIEHIIAVLTGHRVAFTHGRDYAGNIVRPVEWISKNDYERLDAQYERIRVDSKKYFTKSTRK